MALKILPQAMLTILETKFCGLWNTKQVHYNYESIFHLFSHFLREILIVSCTRAINFGKWGKFTTNRRQVNEVSLRWQYEHFNGICTWFKLKSSFTCDSIWGLGDEYDNMMNNDARTLLQYGGPGAHSTQSRGRPRNVCARLSWLVHHTYRSGLRRLSFENAILWNKVFSSHLIHIMTKIWLTYITI